MAAAEKRPLPRWQTFNPCVAVHELRMRMRGARPFVVMLAYALLASLAVVITYLVMTARDYYYYGPSSSYGPDSAEVGRASFTVLSFVQLSLIVILVPALSAGAITMERERRTLDMLRATLLSAFDIITGKKLVVLAFVGLLLVTTLPGAAWSVLLGGVQPREVFFVYTYLFAVASLIASLGFLLSALVRQTLGAVIGVYLILLLTLAGLPAAYMAIGDATGALYGSSPGAVASAALPLAIIAVAGLSVFVGWFVYLAVRWLSASIFGSRWRTAGVAVSALIGVVVCSMLLGALAGPLVSGAASGLEWEAPLVLHPFVALAAILFPDVAEDLIDWSAVTSGVPPIDAQPYIWGVVCVFAVVLALSLWALAVKAFRARP